MANKVDCKTIADWITLGASVLDLGCGDGELLAYLVQAKQVHAQGIELNEDAIVRCVNAGLSVYQQDIDTGLSEYGDKIIRLRHPKPDATASQKTRLRTTGRHSASAKKLS